MGILDKYLEEYQKNDATEHLSQKSIPLATKMEKNIKTNKTKYLECEKINPQTQKPKLVDPKMITGKATKINTLEEKDDFVSKVACMRELETSCFLSSSSFNKKNNISFVRTSDKCDKADCDSCPAAGFSDYNGPGKWCFHTAYYLGKSGHPILCETARYDCQLKGTK